MALTGVDQNGFEVPAIQDWSEYFQTSITRVAEAVNTEGSTNRSQNQAFHIFKEFPTNAQSIISNFLIEIHLLPLKPNQVTM